jgi:sec-independent protein translocase protein TatA
MFDVGGGELLLILMAVLLLFGPSKLPELARSFGKGMAQFRRAQTEFQRNLNSISEEIESTVQDQPPPKTLTPSPKKYEFVSEFDTTSPPEAPPSEDASSGDVSLESAPPSPMPHIRPAEQSIARTQ